MANFTKQAIKASFMKLLNEYPLSKISVRDIVEDCGINRNSFYYHYQDVPALIEELITEVFDSLIEKYPNISSLVDFFTAVTEYTVKNRKALLHIYNSVNRDIFEKYLMKFSEYAVKTYLDTAFCERKVSDADRDVIVRFIKCEIFGLYLDWLSAELPEDSIDEIKRMLTLCHGMSSQIIKKSMEDD